jgi:trehalose 6-phosphate phosphatase
MRLLANRLSCWLSFVRIVCQDLTWQGSVPVEADPGFPPGAVDLVKDWCDERVNTLINKIKPALARATWFIALDRDGTLVPIVDEPARAIVTDAVRRVVTDLAAEPGVRVAVVSARGTRRLAADFDPGRVVLAGSYGLEILFPGGAKFVHPAASAAVPQLGAVKQEIQRLLPYETGVILEDHGVSLCLHWHCVEPDRQALVHDIASRLKQAFPEVWFKTMPTSYEVQPPVEWDKGRALDEIESRLGMDSTSTAYVYAGDSDSDEVAFQWVNARGGVSIRVGAPLPTNASLQLDEPADLEELLRDLLSLWRCR